MEFKKSYKFMDLLIFIIFFGVFLVGEAALITWIIVYGISQGKLHETLIALIFLGICFVALFVILLVLCRCVTVDEEKIEVKWFKRVILSYNINDIYKIEIKIGAKGIPVFIIHGNTPQIHPCKIETINLLADEKREKILRHFIPNPDVWITDLKTYMAVKRDAS